PPEARKAYVTRLVIAKRHSTCEFAGRLAARAGPHAGSCRASPSPAPDLTPGLTQVPPGLTQAPAGPHAGSRRALARTRSPLGGRPGQSYLEHADQPWRVLANRTLPELREQVVGVRPSGVGDLVRIRLPAEVRGGVADQDMVVLVLHPVRRRVGGAVEIHPYLGQRHARDAELLGQPAGRSRRDHLTRAGVSAAAVRPPGREPGLRRRSLLQQDPAQLINEQHGEGPVQLARGGVSLGHGGGAGTL